MHICLTNLQAMHQTKENNLRCCRQEARRLEEERLIEAVANSEGKRRVNWQIWFLTMCGCACIVACGVAPAFILPINSGAFLQTRGM